MKTLALALVSLTLSTAALADVSVVFREGAPKDRFTIENTSGCSLDGAVITIDLSKSKAGLIFDVTDQGAGVEVFQPFELVAGADYLTAVPAVRDGDNKVDLALKTLPKGQNVSFTVDVDDTIGQREITVSGAEIQGAAVTVKMDGKTNSATFGRNARASLPTC